MKGLCNAWQRWRPNAIIVGVVIGCAILPARTVHAHPYGISSVNRLIAAEVTPDGLRLAFVLDFAELPAENELRVLDQNHDDSVSAQEQQSYLAQRVDHAVAQWRIEWNHQPLRPTIVSRALEVHDGEARLHTLRVMAEVRATLPAGSANLPRSTLLLSDLAYRDRPGWRELRVQDSETLAARLVTALPASDASALLRMDEAVFELTTVGNPTTPRTPSAQHSESPRTIPTKWLALAGIVLLVVISTAQALAERHRQKGAKKS